MQLDLITLMTEEVRTLYRALTGAELPDASAEAEAEADEPEAVTRRFAALEALARGEPRIAANVPPFSFTPAMNAIARDGEIVVELALPGVDREDVDVAVIDGLVVITGLRRDPLDQEGGAYTCGEIPRGPFHRALRAPFPLCDPPTVDLDRGLLRVRLTRAPADARPDDAGA